MSRILAKMEAAARQAHMLLDAGEADGAAGRAYYAMFHGARAALEVIDPSLIDAKTHATIIRRFGLHVVRPGFVDAQLGRLISEAEGLRLTADYDTVEIDLESTKQIVIGMDVFISEVRAFVARRKHDLGVER